MIIANTRETWAMRPKLSLALESNGFVPVYDRRIGHFWAHQALPYLACFTEDERNTFAVFRKGMPKAYCANGHHHERILVSVIESWATADIVYVHHIDHALPALLDVSGFALPDARPWYYAGPICRSIVRQFLEETNRDPEMVKDERAAWIELCNAERDYGGDPRHHGCMFRAWDLIKEIALEIQDAPLGVCAEEERDFWMSTFETTAMAEDDKTVAGLLLEYRDTYLELVVERQRNAARAAAAGQGAAAGC